MRYKDSCDFAPDLTAILKAIAQDVFEAIPAPAQRQIESVCECVEFMGLEERGTAAHFSAQEKYIGVNVRNTRAYSERGQRGILAHEFAHAYDYAVCRVRPTPQDKDQRNDLADRYACEWGFCAEILSMHREAKHLK